MQELNYRLVEKPEDVAAACEELSRSGEVGFDTETTSLSPFEGRVRLVQLASEESVSVFDLDRLAPDGEAARAESLEPLRRLLAATRPVKVAHNAKFDAKWVRHFLGVERYLGKTVDKTLQVSDWGGELSPAQIEYAARDAALMLPLRAKLVGALRANSLTRIAQLEFECVVPLAALELAGIYLEQACWRGKLKEIERRRNELYERLQDELAEEPAQQSLFGPVRADLNLDSHVQLTRALTRVIGDPKRIPDSTRNWKLA